MSASASASASSGDPHNVVRQYEDLDSLPLFTPTIWEKRVAQAHAHAIFAPGAVRDKRSEAIRKRVKYGFASITWFSDGEDTVMSDMDEDDAAWLLYHHQDIFETAIHGFIHLVSPTWGKTVEPKAALHAMRLLAIVVLVQKTVSVFPTQYHSLEIDHRLWQNLNVVVIMFFISHVYSINEELSSGTYYSLNCRLQALGKKHLALICHDTNGDYVALYDVMAKIILFAIDDEEDTMSAMTTQILHCLGVAYQVTLIPTSQESFCSCCRHMPVLFQAQVQQQHANWLIKYYYDYAVANGYRLSINVHNHVDVLHTMCSAIEQCSIVECRELLQRFLGDVIVLNPLSISSCDHVEEQFTHAYNYYRQVLDLGATVSGELDDDGTCF
jgi:hypothetical protein